MIVGMAPTVVFLHGFTHTGRSWQPAIAALGERYTSVAEDIRGHGDASAREPVTLGAVIDDVLAGAPDRFTLVGYSMGGRVSLHVALAAAAVERVDRLVLIGASPGIADPVARQERRRADEQLADEIERSSIEEFARRWAQTPVLAGLPPAVLAAAHADRLRSTPAGLARALRGLGTGALPSLWDRLGELPMPVTLVVGERDSKFRGIATEMAGGIPAADVVVVPGAGHAVHLESPEAIASALPLR
ncbi:MAG: 2-succinyl-6-hydroxy-2,4-cyclohexadiene-1-carboxylate synthase [Solirubrobacteraceae bacterium]